MTVRIAQLTDLHLTAEPGARVWGADVWSNLRAALAHLGSAGGADLLVLTGDLANERIAATYARMRQELEEWEGRLCVLPGNHDDRELLWAAFAALRQPGDGAGFHRQIGGWTLLGLDSKWPWRVRGRLWREQLDWLAAALQAGQAPALLFVHHPPIRVGAWWLDKDRPRGRRRLAMVLRGSRVRGIGCGHVHQAVTGEFAGVPVWTTPAVAYQFRPHSSWPGLRVRTPGYRVFELDGERMRTRVVEP